MTYEVVEVFSDSISIEWLQKITSFCEKAGSENKHDAAINMQVHEWQNQPQSLLYLLCIEKRFHSTRGGLFLLISDNEIIALSGYYKADFNDQIYIMGVRSWVLKPYRLNLLIADYLLTSQFEKIKTFKAKMAIITFNESTKAFADLIQRTNKNLHIENKFFFGKNYPKIYEDMVLVDFPVNIKKTKQWILIKKLSDIEFDWNTLRWTDK